MVSIHDVASYICIKKGSVTTMKLQKLCYYAQAWSLAWDDLPIFPEDFQAWNNGPVCPELFAAYKGLFEVSAANFPQGSPDRLDKDQKETIDVVLREYGDLEPHELSELTHTEMPWKEARSGYSYLPGENCTANISKNSMQEYYAGLIRYEQ